MVRSHFPPSNRALLHRALPYLVGIAGGLLGSSCSSEPGGPSEPALDAGVRLEEAPAPSLTELKSDAVNLSRAFAASHDQLKPVLAEAPRARLRLSGHSLIPVQEDTAFDMGLEVSAVASGTTVLFPLDDRDDALTLTPIGASDSPASLSDDGRAVFQSAFRTADVVLTQAPNRLEHTIVIRDQSSPDNFAWHFEAASGLKRVGLEDYATAFVDQKGNLRLTAKAAHIIDANGKSRAAPLAFDDNGIVRLAIDHEGLAYPIVASFGFETPPLGRLDRLPQGNLIKGRVMIMLDTSGSMIWHFADQTSADGDGPNGTGPGGAYLTAYCGPDVGGFSCGSACTGTAGLNLWPQASNANPSRMYASKAAIQNVVSAHAGLVDFGLGRFAVATDSPACVNTDYCCDPDTGACQDSSYYNTAGTDPSITFRGGCGSSDSSGNAGPGGRVLVSPSSTSGPQVLQWVNYRENFCDSGGDVPVDPEIRGNGPTPLARQIRSARDWYQGIYNAGSDPDINCRPYALVVMSDGIDTCSAANDNNCPGTSSANGLGQCTCASAATCGGGWSCISGICATADPSNEVTSLTAVNNVNPIKTYVLGMGNASALDTGELDEMAAAGLTTTAKLATNQQEIEAAFADIVAETVKFENCNNLDDNCNTFIDEGLGVYQDCQNGGQCGSGVCNAGRCTCTADSQCDQASGYVCDQSSPTRFCRPSCTAAYLKCENKGVKKCGAGPGQCCVDNGVWNCDDILDPPNPDPETCNGEDDDCDGKIDEGLTGCDPCIPFTEICNGKDDDCDTNVDEDPIPGEGEPCGRDTGACEPGQYQCINGKFECIGGAGPFTEVCNGLDDDCDKIIDGQSRVCYTPGLNDPTRNVGICHDGAEKCIATTSMPGANVPGVECTNTQCWSDCVGERTPETEVCNGLDDDCDGPIDEDLTTPDGQHTVGDACCLYQNAGEDLCGVGICEFGEYICDVRIRQVICVGGKGPEPEICNMLDDDCNGIVDDVPGVGTPCQTPAGCKGTLECDYTSGGLTCVPEGTPDPELCNGLDDDCDNAVDEEPDVLSDPALKGECKPPTPPHDQPPCKAGKKVCRNGMIDCDGWVGPGDEICNGQDDDCDGVGDEEGTCPEGSMCDDGECKVPCQGGEFPCPGGLCCNSRNLCEVCGTGGTGGNGTGGGSGEGGNAGNAGDGSGGDAGTSGGEGGGAGDGAGGGAGTSGPGDGGGGGDDKSKNVFGLATGGGGCACRTAPEGPGNLGSLAFAALALGALKLRRRQSRNEGGVR